MPPKRDRSSKDLPENLYESTSRPGYFRYHNPVTGKWITVGRIPRREAISQAIEANLYLAGQQAAPRLVDQLIRGTDHTVGAWIDRYEREVLPKRKLASNTMRLKTTHGKAVKAAALSGLIIDRVEILDVANFLKAYVDDGKDRMALGLWSYLKDLFAAAIGAGWIPSKVNVVVHTSRPSADVKRARLTLEAFNKIYQAAAGLPVWVQRSMELAIVSAQRREDLAVAEFKERKGSRVWAGDGRLWVWQEKTKAKVRLPLELRLDVVGWSLTEVIERCRDEVLSPWMLHHSRHAGPAKPGQAVHVNTLTRGFQWARERSGLAWPAVDEAGAPQTPPTFHEIRSLAARLYEAQGKVDVQVLLGHKDPATTAVYRDPRGAEWQELRLGQS